MAALQAEDGGRLDTRPHAAPLLGGREGKKRGSLDAVHPLILLLCGRGRDSVKSVVSLDDASVRLRLAGFDHLILVVGDEELKAVL